MFPWNSGDLALLAVLPVSLAISGIFSGSETAIFGLRRRDQRALNAQGGPAGLVVAQLQASPRLLLITLLLGNMATNVTFFLTSSALLLRMNPTALGPAGPAVMSIVFLALIVVIGEVLPKVVASGTPVAWIRSTAFFILMVHGFLTPVRMLLSSYVISPLIRLILSSAAHSRLNETELETLLEISRESKVIDRDEEAFLADVVNLRRQKTRDVMTPRIEVQAVPFGAERDEVAALARQTRVSQLVVYEENLDRVVGILDVRPFLLSFQKSVSGNLNEPVFVPELATLDHLTDTLARESARLAVVVDEYGQTSGVVSFDDLVREIVGSPGADRSSLTTTIMTGLNQWTVDGRVGVHEFAEAFDIDLDEPKFATLSGIVSDMLARVPEPDDCVELGEYRITVRRVERGIAIELGVERMESCEE